MKVEQHIPIPQRRKKLAVSPTLKRAVADYKEAYHGVFRVTPQLTYDGTWIRIQGHQGGVSLRRLKELTTQLNLRRG